MKKLLFLLTLAIAIGSFAQSKKENPLISERFALADAQYHYLMQHLPADKFPKTFFPARNEYEFSDSKWWCSGFYPGSLLLIFEQTKDSALYQEAMRIMEILEQEKYNTSTHDLGFMMYCSFGTANRLQPSERYKQILIQSAKSLCTRFNPATGCIRSWNGKPGEFLVIIDNMMNLELLMYAFHQTGDSSFYKIAVTHANTTIKNHFRKDYSSYHVINYDEKRGAVLEKKTAQGAADSSAWARGQAWGLYGFTMMYRETKDKKYLAQAQHIADFILGHPNLPKDKIPFWDFNAPGIPIALRDASAAAIISSALFELQQYVSPSLKKKYLLTAKRILLSLSKPPYFAAPNTNGGFILQHCVGHFPNQTEVDVPLTYADYYYLEALKRFREMKY